MDLLPMTTSAEQETRGARVALLPVGSYEQHGDHLPLATDTMVASILAAEIAERYALMPLPPITISCSHEHVGWTGTVSIRAVTLAQIIVDISESLHESGIDKLAIISGHGGNYILSNVTQEANTHSPRMALFPTREDWEAARSVAGIESSIHDDMHAGELETSILLHYFPQNVGTHSRESDHISDRPHLLTLGMREYTDSGVIGAPSLATAAKGRLVVSTLVKRFGDTLIALGDPP
ncbi:creatininase family protein [Polymorphospora sp. NPDC050346]|uniref:creatininase family protein n=1 Tax=Polymorphospora sp. NPDC050346 TaxID=3155780 RepID=UPI0033E18B19